MAHGSSFSHKMAIIFNEAGLADIKPPCVAQTFVNHNAVLYKIFVIGDQYFVVERPSLKNFKAGGIYHCNSGTPTELCDHVINTIQSSCELFEKTFK